MRPKGWCEDLSNEGEEQEKASDGEGTSASTDEREVSSETLRVMTCQQYGRETEKTGRKTGLAPDKQDFLRHYP